MGIYGIEIKNIYDEIILNNTPYSVLKIVDGYPKIAPRNTSKYNSIFSCAEGEVIFIRASDNGKVGGNAGSDLSGISTAQGNLTYVKLISCANTIASGYGLAGYAEGTSTPQLVFADNIRFAKLAYSGNVTAPTTVSIPEVSQGMARYVSISSFGLCGNTDRNTGQMLSIKFTNNTAIISSEADDLGSKTFVGGFSTRSISLTIIEC